MQRLHLSRKRHRQLDNRRFVAAEWARLFSDLHRERGLWGSESSSPLDKWQLDPLEGPSRMRKKLRLNARFYQDYPYDPQGEAEDADETSEVR